MLAGGIPGAEFVELDTHNHILLEHEPAWRRFREAVLAFLRSEAAIEDAAFGALSVRERQVLALMTDGLSNTDIAERLQISEKTVRSHASNVFDKPGVWSRRAGHRVRAGSRLRTLIQRRRRCPSAASEVHGRGARAAVSHTRHGLSSVLPLPALERATLP